MPVLVQWPLRALAGRFPAISREAARFKFGALTTTSTTIALNLNPGGSRQCQWPADSDSSWRQWQWQTQAQARVGWRMGEM